MQILGRLGLLPLVLGAWAQTPDPPPQKSFLFINGGSSPIDNYSSHEKDILSFNTFLFNGKAKILNAGGHDTLVLPIDDYGYALRMPDGSAMMGPTSIPGAWGAMPATKADVMSTFKKIAESKPDQLTVVYGDHGDAKGVVLWNEESLGANDIHRLENELPPDTLVRGLHLHCYGGAAMVDPERKIPDRLNQMAAFLDANYPANRCDLALSGSDEVGQYYDWQGDWRNGNWAQIFVQLPHPSLLTLKRRFASASLPDRRSDPTLHPAPWLTSDYLVHDLKAFICSRENAAAADGSHGDAESASAVSVSVSNADLCSSRREKMVGDETRQYLQSLNEWQDAGRAVNFWVRQYAQKNDPSLYAAYAAAVAQCEALKSRYANAPDGMPGAARLKVQALTKSALLPYQLYSESVAARPAFNAYLQAHCTKEWIQKNQAAYPALFSASSRAAAFTGIFQLRRDLLRATYDKQASRRWDSLRLQDNQREAVEAWLADPRNASIKERYENIRRCEASVVN